MRIMRSQRSDMFILLLSIVPVILGIALVVHANSDGSVYFVNDPTVLPSYIPAPVVAAMQPFLNWTQTISYMPLATREELAFGIVVGGIGCIVTLMCLMDLLTSARKKRKTRQQEKLAAKRVDTVDEPLQLYVTTSRSTDRGISA